MVVRRPRHRTRASRWRAPRPQRRQPGTGARRLPLQRRPARLLPSAAGTPGAFAGRLPGRHRPARFDQRQRRPAARRAARQRPARCRRCRRQRLPGLAGRRPVAEQPAALPYRRPEHPVALRAGRRHRPPARRI
ncbi:hypothetical protein SDC9_176530 [bioreactor metagenome]|uniref:Uncharacterized protein n=1 Tax=bioreactor metagenome TaxID=1076179 RepID=A0A645GQ98_9ZZZZ